MTVKSKKDTGETRRYRTPALEKGLDILELLATRAEPLSHSRIAAELDRSISEVFRMLSCLEDRGYIARGEAGEGFVLTMRLHELAHNWPPSRRLVEVALPEMRALAEQSRQSCHLGVYNSGALYVLAEAASPMPVGLTVKTAMDFPLLKTASGRVLLAWQPRSVAERWIAASRSEITAKAQKALFERLTAIREQGYELSLSDLMNGLNDISCPVLDRDGYALAALTVPYLVPLDNPVDLDRVRVLVAQSAAAISKKMGLGMSVEQVAAD